MTTNHPQPGSSDTSLIPLLIHDDDMIQPPTNNSTGFHRWFHGWFHGPQEWRPMGVDLLFQREDPGNRPREPKVLRAAGHGTVGQAVNHHVVTNG